MIYLKCFFIVLFSFSFVCAKKNKADERLEAEINRVIDSLNEE